MTDLPTLKPPTWETIEVGERLGPTELLVDEHHVRRFAFTVEDYRPWHLGERSPFGPPVAHAAALLPDMLRLFNTVFDPAADTGLHQKEQIWFHEPARIGDRVVLEGEVVDKYVKRGKEYVVTEAEARRASDGALLVRHQAIEITAMNSSIELGGGSERNVARRVEGVWPEDRELAETARADLPLGTPAAGAVKRIRQDQMSVFSNVEQFWHTLHTDREVALAAGFEDTLAQALMGTAHISELATRLFGAAWFTSGWIAQSYLAPIYAGDAVQARAVLVDSSEDEAGARLEFEAWVENQSGSKVAVGWFAATLPVES